MAIRVRKLAKELERSPAEVLGLLHAIGFERYRSAEDQVPDPTVQHIRTAIRNGVKPYPVVLEDGPRPVASTLAKPSAKVPDLMARLVPGVRPVDGAPRTAHMAVAPVPRLVAPRIVPEVPVGDPAEAAEQRAHTLALLAELDAARAALSAEREAISREQAAVTAAALAMAAERERQRLEGARLAAASVSLIQVLEARGYTTLEAQEQALTAGDRLRRLLPLLRVTDIVAVASEFGERPSAPARAPTPGVPADLDNEVPEGSERELSRIGDRLMLLGLRRLVVVGGNPRLARLLRDAIDPRIDLRFRPGNGRPRPRVEAEVDVTRSDAVVLWGLAVEPDAMQTYHTSRAVVVEVPDTAVPSLIAAVNRRLDEV